MQREHPINDLLEISLDKVNKMVDTGKIVGQPIILGNEKYIIPISKVTFGYGAGGTEIPNKKKKEEKKKKKEKMEFDAEIALEPYYNLEQKNDPMAFGGGSGGGVTITPQAFFIIEEGKINLKSVEQKSAALDKIFEFVSRFINKDTGAK